MTTGLRRECFGGLQILDQCHLRRFGSGSMAPVPLGRPNIPYHFFFGASSSSTTSMFLATITRCSVFMSPIVNGCI